MRTDGVGGGGEVSLESLLRLDDGDWFTPLPPETLKIIPRPVFIRFPLTF